MNCTSIPLSHRPQARATACSTSRAARSRAWNFELLLVPVELWWWPVGVVEGEGTAAVVARLEAAVEAGNYEAALAEYETLPQAAKDAGSDFIAMVRARRSADMLIEQALSAALDQA